MLLDKLPRELALMVLEYVANDAKTLISASQTCRVLHHISRNNRLWSAACESLLEETGYHPEWTQLDGIDYYDLYRTQIILEKNLSRAIEAGQGSLGNCVGYFGVRCRRIIVRLQSMYPENDQLASLGRMIPVIDGYETLHHLSMGQTDFVDTVLALNKFWIGTQGYWVNPDFVHPDAVVLQVQHHLPPTTQDSALAYKLLREKLLMFGLLSEQSTQSHGSLFMSARSEDLSPLGRAAILCYCARKLGYKANVVNFVNIYVRIEVGSRVAFADINRGGKLRTDQELIELFGSYSFIMSGDPRAKLKSTPFHELTELAIDTCITWLGSAFYLPSDTRLFALLGLTSVRSLLLPRGNDNIFGALRIVPDRFETEKHTLTVAFQRIHGLLDDNFVNEIELLTKVILPDSSGTNDTNETGVEV